MSGESAIEWTNSTWNPVTGCDRVSPGCLCAHCYALDIAARLKAMGSPRYQRDGDPKTSGPGFGLTLHPDKLEEPLRWRKPRMVFVNSMSDLFHEAVPFEFIARVFDVMASEQGQRHIFQVLTKRPERMIEFIQWHGEWWPGDSPLSVALEVCGNPGPNIWLGTSIENRRFVHRADLLRETPAAVRFVSAEPLLGPLVPDHADSPDPCDDCGERATREWRGFIYCDACASKYGLDLTDISWLIVGGESGPNHRHMNPEWVRDLRDACLAQRVDPTGKWERSMGRPHTAFFVKQGSGPRPGQQGNLPDDLWAYKEFPEGGHRGG